MKKKYGALRLFGTIYKIMGFSLLGATVLAAIGVIITSLLGSTLFSAMVDQVGNGALSGSAPLALLGLLFALGISLYGGIIGVSLVAMGEGLYLLIDIEENTRMTARYLQNQ